MGRCARVRCNIEGGVVMYCKVDWKDGDGVLVSDLNRIEENTLEMLRVCR